MRALLIIVHYTAQIYIVQNCKKPMKAAETAVDIILDVLKNSHGNFCSEVLDKVVACQHGICKLFRTKTFPRFSEHTKGVTVKRYFVKKKCS